LSKPPTPANDLLRRRHVERLLFAGNSLDKARALFAAYGRRRPHARLTPATREIGFIPSAESSFHYLNTNLCAQADAFLATG
jgi:hypothetical protein